MTDTTPSKSSAQPGQDGIQDPEGHQDLEGNQGDEHQAQSESDALDIGPIPESSSPVRSQADTVEKRVADSDRRSTDRRRSARGLFEILARREQVDRRQLNRRSERGKFRLAFWRRSGS